MPKLIEDVNFRVLARCISYADFVVSFSGAVIALGMTVLTTRLWSWDHYGSSCLTPENVNATTTSGTDTRTTAGQPKESSPTIMDVNSIEEVLATWLLFIVLFLILTVRTSSAFALYKATAKNKSPKKAAMHSGYWAAIAICSTFLMGFIVLETYAGAFSKISLISAADFYCYWLFGLYQIGSLGIVLGFVLKL